MTDNWQDYNTYWENHWLEVGPRYFVTGMTQEEYNDYYRTAFAPFKKSGVSTVFDLGCGTGMMLQLVREWWPDARYVGLDISEQAIEYNKALMPDAEWIAMTGPELPGKADVIFVISVFTHISLEDTAQYLDVIREALNPGGRAIVSIHIDSEDGVIGDIPRVDIQPALFEDLLHAHGFRILCCVDGIQRYYEVEPC